MSYFDKYECEKKQREEQQRAAAARQREYRDVYHRAAQELRDSGLVDKIQAFLEDLRKRTDIDLKFHFTDTPPEKREEGEVHPVTGAASMIRVQAPDHPEKASNSFHVAWQKGQGFTLYFYRFSEWYGSPGEYGASRCYSYCFTKTLPVAIKDITNEDIEKWCASIWEGKPELCGVRYKKYGGDTGCCLGLVVMLLMLLAAFAIAFVW